MGELLAWFSEGVVGLALFWLVLGYFVVRWVVRTCLQAWLGVREALEATRHLRR